jgi:exoribonuclease R
VYDCASPHLLSSLVSVCPIENRNRAFEGDVVVVVLLPIDQWGARGSEELTHKNTATVADALQGEAFLEGMYIERYRG